MRKFSPSPLLRVLQVEVDVCEFKIASFNTLVLLKDEQIKLLPAIHSLMYIILLCPLVSWGQCAESQQVALGGGMEENLCNTKSLWVAYGGRQHRAGDTGREKSSRQMNQAPKMTWSKASLVS